jgi:hypothetical protein
MQLLIQFFRVSKNYCLFQVILTRPLEAPVPIFVEYAVLVATTVADGEGAADCDALWIARIILFLVSTMNKS